MADISLAGQVIASHYAEPVIRYCLVETALTAEPDGGADPIMELNMSDAFAVLECGRGFAWGYAVSGHRVGYVDETALG